MKATKQLKKQLGRAGRQLQSQTKRMGKWGRSALAGVAGMAVLLGNAGKLIGGKAADIKDYAFHQNHKKSGEVITLKKSTVIGLLVAVAAVAGVLAALYFYVIRREKELDEYEQLLFSEDFNDDLLDDDVEAVPASEPVKAE